MYYRKFVVHKSLFTRKTPHNCEKQRKPAMEDRRESTRNTLGLLEYPWSTDEEDGDLVERTQGITSSSELNRLELINLHSRLMSMTRPITSSQPERSSQPGTSSQPGMSSQPETSSQPNTSSQPGSSSQPGTSQPGSSSQPGTSQPGTSSTSNAGSGAAPPNNSPAATPGRPSLRVRNRASLTAPDVGRSIGWAEHVIDDTARRAVESAQAGFQSLLSSSARTSNYDPNLNSSRRYMHRHTRNVATQRSNNSPYRPQTYRGNAENAYQMFPPSANLPPRSERRSFENDVMRPVNPQRVYHDSYRPRDRIICQVERSRYPSLHQRWSRLFGDSQPSTSSGITRGRPNRFLYYDEAVAAANPGFARSGTEPANLSNTTDSDDDSPLAPDMSLEDVLEIEPAQEATEEQPADDNQQSTQTPQNTEVAEAPTSDETREESAAQAGSEQTPRPPKRRKSQSPAETVTGLNQSLLRLLECPVCLECMEPPMSQCRRGHIVCVSCRSRLSTCPVCRTAFSSVRNRAMEGVSELVRYPCRHSCGRETRLRRRAVHEASCAARRYPCPAPPCSGRVNLTRPELGVHLQTKHAEMIKTGRKQKFTLRVNEDQHDTWIVNALDEMFKANVHVDIRNWELWVHVAYIGPKNNAKNYSYDVTVLGKYQGRSAVYTRTTHNDLEHMMNNIVRRDCFYMTLDQAMNFLKTKSRETVTTMDVSVKISKVTSNEDREGSDDS